MNNKRFPNQNLTSGTSNTTQPGSRFNPEALGLNPHAKNTFFGKIDLKGRGPPLLRRGAPFSQKGPPLPDAKGRGAPLLRRGAQPRTAESATRTSFLPVRFSLKPVSQTITKPPPNI